MSPRTNDRPRTRPLPSQDLPSMNKPLTSWKKSLAALGFKVNWDAVLRTKNRKMLKRQQDELANQHFHIENLEERQMLSTVTDFAFDTDNTLTVTGTDVDDTITISVTSGGKVEVGGQETPVNAVDVSSIRVFAMGGNDQVALNSVTVADFSSLGSIVIDGGEGNDTLIGSPGDDTIFGGGGNDIIDANGGNDTISGGPDDDAVINGVDGDSDALQADPNRLLATDEGALVVKLGQFDSNTSFDLAILNSDGTLTIATNGDDGTWQSRQTIDLGVGPLHGMELSLVNGDALPDLIIQGSDSLFVALNDGDGNFSVSQTLTPFAAGEMAPGVGDFLDLEVADLNGDFFLDVVALAPGVDQLAVYYGVGDGTFSAALIESTGGSVPTSLVSGDFVGNGFPDLAVGHADGSVTLLENNNGNDFTNRPDLTVAGFSPITDLASADLDGDGDADIVVASGEQLTILGNEQNPLENLPTITNGSFGQGLTGWNTEIVGQRTEGLAGTVIAQSGFVQLVENESFLVSANQEFVVPENPETIEVDILSIGLEDPAGGIPDAFEISILDADGNSLVPTFRPNASSFFNVNPGDDVSFAPGVSFDGTTVSVDISAIQAGTEATIYFDLIGNGPGTGSTVTFDDVRITPTDEFDSLLTQTVLEGPFVNVNQIVIDDLDGDQSLDIAAVETAGDTLLVFNGQADGSFVREDIDLSSLGTGLVSLDASPLTTGDDVSDLVVLADGNNVAISPLSADDTAPTAELLSPIAGQTNTGDVSRIDIGFSEQMRDLGSDDSMSVTNPDNYTVTFLGADGVEGTADDQTLAIVGVAYAAMTGVASLNLDPASTPLEDGVYVVTLNSQNLKDSSGNPLADGADVSFEFTLNQEGPVVAALAPLTGTEGGVVEFFTDFTDASGAAPYTATVNWGDGSVASLENLDFTDGTGTLAASHVYADNGTYDITLTIEDADGIATQSFGTATIANVAPVVVAGDDATVLRNQEITLALGEFTDLGFDNVDTDTVESFTATIDWGDGTSSDGAVESITGAPGTPSSGSVSGTHTFTTAGTFVVTVTVADDDGGVDSQQLTITVADDAPSVATPAECRWRRR